MEKGIEKTVISAVMSELGKKSWAKRKNKVGELERLQNLNKSGVKSVPVDKPLTANG